MLEGINMFYLFRDDLLKRFNICKRLFNCFGKSIEKSSLAAAQEMLSNLFHHPSSLISECSVLMSSSSVCTKIIFNKFTYIYIKLINRTFWINWCNGFKIFLFWGIWNQKRPLHCPQGNYDIVSLIAIIV